MRMVPIYATVIFHALWIVILIAGVPLGWFFSGYAAAQISLLSLTIASWAFCSGCPLTHLENKFRRRIDPSIAYRGQCTDYYVSKLTRKKLPAWAIRSFMWALMAASAAIYVFQQYTSSI